MPLFSRGQEDDQPEQSVADFPVEATLAHFTALSVPQRAAEILAAISATLDKETGAYNDRMMSDLLAPWLSDRLPVMTRRKLSPAQAGADAALRLILLEAFGVLVLTRMVIRVEKVQAVAPYYLLGADGRAALQRGDATAVIARRLPD